jgi:RNA polymerase sigma factor (TIGR02999 family)
LPILSPGLEDVTQILCRIEQGKATARDLLPAVYEELRRIAHHKMAGERAGHTLQATALVHEAWLRLGADKGPDWKNRRHFFAAAAEAMRRILVDHARRHGRKKRGSGTLPLELSESSIQVEAPPDELLAVHEALDALQAEDPQTAELVKLRYFIGLTMEEAAQALGLRKRAAEELWTYGKAWLHRAIRREA